MPPKQESRSAAATRIGQGFAPLPKHGLTADQMGPRLSDKEKEERRRWSNKMRKEQVYYGNKERKNIPGARPPPYQKR